MTSDRLLTKQQCTAVYSGKQCQLDDQHAGRHFRQLDSGQRLEWWGSDAITSKERSQRPVKVSTSSHYNWLMDMAKWCDIHWELSSMHMTCENAIMRAADQKEEIERLRAALGSAVLMVNKLKVFGADNVQRFDVEPWLTKVRERFPDLPNAWPFSGDSSAPKIPAREFDLESHQGLYTEPPAVETTGERRGPVEPDNSMVICPYCTSQFVAVPVNTQTRLRESQDYSIKLQRLIERFCQGVELPYPELHHHQLLANLKPKGTPESGICSCAWDFSKEPWVLLHRDPQCAKHGGSAQETPREPGPMCSVCDHIEEMHKSMGASHPFTPKASVPLPGCVFRTGCKSPEVCRKAQQCESDFAKNLRKAAAENGSGELA